MCPIWKKVMGVVGFLNMAGRSEAVVPGPVWGGVNGLAARPMLLGWNWVKWRRGRAVNEGPMKTLEAGVTRLQPWIASNAQEISKHVFINHE